VKQETPLSVVLGLIARRASSAACYTGTAISPLNERNGRERQRKCGEEAEHDGEHDDGHLGASKRVRVRCGPRVDQRRGGAGCCGGQGRWESGPWRCRGRGRKNTHRRSIGNGLICEIVEPHKTVVSVTRSARLESLDGHVERVLIWIERA
jgi:hypothetical protein